MMYLPHRRRVYIGGAVLALVSLLVLYVSIALWNSITSSDDSDAPSQGYFEAHAHGAGRTILPLESFVVLFLLATLLPLVQKSTLTFQDFIFARARDRRNGRAPPGIATTFI